MENFKLSIVMPAYNEEKTLLKSVNNVLDCSFTYPYEFIVVNDGSTDSTAHILESINYGEKDFKFINCDKNAGKGNAVRTGVARASGSHILIFDADEEYDIKDVDKLLPPLVNSRAEIVYGVRVRGHSVLQPSLLHHIGNVVMTAYANLLFKSAISDLHTCIKIVPRELFNQLNLEENGFGLDTELTAKILSLKLRPFEMPISYVGRSKEEGKKITFKDAIICFYILTKIRLFYKGFRG